MPVMDKSTFAEPFSVTPILTQIEQDKEKIRRGILKGSFDYKLKNEYA
jgi:hypothetical protein